MADLRIHLNIRGIVQGVGFRPFLHRLTERFHLSGWAKNTSAGVELELEGDSARLADFLWALEGEKPPLAVIQSIERIDLPCVTGETGFRILPSTIAERVALVSPDVGICPDCLRELTDPADRRHRYPFLNCTNCGPRFTIVKDVPYDRERTSMAAFPMCPSCDAEYHDITDRRYHAQPDCCAEGSYQSL
jgi:hydrogenase maturation protein HypF